MKNFDEILSSLKSLVLTQYKEEPVIDAFLYATAKELLLIHQTLDNLLHQRTINTAMGKQLDLIGISYGELRQGRDDSDYRLAIFMRIIMNQGGGTPEDIIRTIKFIYGTPRVFYSEPPETKATFQVFFQTNFFVPTIRNLIESVSPLGVGEIILMSSDYSNALKVIEVEYGEYDFTLNDNTKLQLSDESTLRVIDLKEDPLGFCVTEIRMNEVPLVLNDENGKMLLEVLFEVDQPYQFELVLDEEGDYTEIATDNDGIVVEVL